MSKKRDAACRYKRLAREGITSVHEDRDGSLVVCEGGRALRRVGVAAPSLGRAQGTRPQQQGDKLVSAREAAARILAVNPNATLKTLPPWIFPFADYMRESSPVAKGRITGRDVIKAYLLTKSSVQRGAISVPKVCKTFPGFKPRERGAKKARPEDVMAELLLSPLGKGFLDDAERGVFNREAAEKIADSFACYGLVYPKAGADLSDPVVLRKTKQLFLADLARAPRLAAQAGAWCLAQTKRSKTFSRDKETGELRRGTTSKTVRRECFGTERQVEAAVARRCANVPKREKCAWTAIKPITAALADPNPKAYYEWAQEYLPGIAAAKVGFFASLLGRGDIPTFDAREINLWFPEGKGTPKWRDVEELKEKIDDFPMELRPGDEPARAHLVHHALWDQFSPNPTATTHEELVEAMQLAGPKRRGVSGASSVRVLPRDDGPREFGFVAVCAEDVCGGITVSEQTFRGERVAKVEGIRVDATRRRTGIATKLYEAAHREACARGLRLASLERNPKAFSNDFWHKQVAKGRATEVATPGGAAYVINGCDVTSLARIKRRKKKPKRRDAVAVAAHVAQRKRGGAHTDKRDRRGKQKRAWRDEE